MNIHDVSTYLLRFDAPAPLPAPLDTFLQEPMEAMPVEPLLEPPTPEPPVDVEAMRRAFDEELAVALEQSRRAHDERLRQARRQWVEEEAELLRDRLATCLAEAFATLRSDVARILAPFVARGVEETAVEELIASIERAIAGDEGPVIRLAGPRDLIDRIAGAFVEKRAAVSVVESDGVDIAVDFASTRIETRLEAWMRRLCDHRSANP